MVAAPIGAPVWSVTRPLMVDGSCAQTAAGRSAAAAIALQSLPNDVFIMCFLPHGTERR
jgi:hypothetical protein